LDDPRAAVDQRIFYRLRGLILYRAFP